MKYATKLGAYGLAVAAAFAVALAVLVSVSSTSTAEARTVDLGTATTVDVEPGDTVTIPGQDSAAIVKYDIVGGTASGSFDSGGGQTLSCSDSTTGRGCDTNIDADAITVKLNVDADSADGYIQVTRTQIVPVPTEDGVQTIVVTVTTQPRPVSVGLKSAKPTVDAATTAADSTVITAMIKFDKTPDATANAGETLTFITTLGSFTACGTTAGLNTQVCADVAVPLADTDGDGTNDAARVTVTLAGANREGTAVITATHASLDPATAEVSLFGTAKSLEAAAEQSSVEIGGRVFVVLTVKDGAGNPVSGAQPVAGEKEVAGPNDDATPVTTGKTDPFTATADVTSPYNVDKNVKNTAADSIPACGDDTTDISDDNSGTQLFATASSGTNGKGQCVVQVTAPADDESTSGTDESATRGVHTISFALGSGANALKASVEITVAGAATTIESDAPDRVDPLSDTTITVTVRDDEGVLVGETDINVIKVVGDGLAEGAATMADAKTKNGSATFSYAAGLEGQVVFRVIAGTGSAAVRDIITLTVGEPEPEAPPEPVDEHEGEATLTVVGNLGVFSGGSVDELAHAVEHTCPGGAQLAAQDADGAWQFWSSSAPAFVNAVFSEAFPDGFADSTPVWVTACDGGGMDNEGEGMGG